IGLMNGGITAEDYEDEAAANPIIDELRDKMILEENETYTKEYLDPEKRSIANAVQVFFTDGTSTDNIVCEYPLGHRFRRDEALPQLREKYKYNMATKYSQKQLKDIEDVSYDYETIADMNVNDFMS